MTGPLPNPVRDEVLASMLAGHPSSWVVAMGDDGFFVPMPGSVPLTGQRVVDGPISALDIVVPDDRILVLQTWDAARAKGFAQATVHMSSAPGRPVQMNFVDVTHSHGVSICLIVTDEAPAGGTAEAPVFLPRVGLVRKDRLAVFTQVDEAIVAILGWRAEDLVGHRSLEFIHPDDHQRAIGHWMDMLTSRSGSRQRVRLRHQHRDGHWVWFEVTNDNRLDDPERGHVLTEMVDISEEMAAHDALRASEHLLRKLTEALPVGVLQVDAARRVVHRNRRVGELLGDPTAGTGTGGPVEAQFAALDDEGRQRLDDCLDATLGLGKVIEFEATVLRTAGSAAVAGTARVRRCSVSLRPLYAGDSAAAAGAQVGAGGVTGAVVCVSDVTEAARLRAELTDRATYDALTRTLNRAAVISVLEDALAAPGAGVGVVFVDLDGFKDVNDRRGHAVGDRLLAHAAMRLVGAARDTDVVGRLGGDEFLVVCAGVADPAEALAVGERFAASLRHPTDVDGESLVPRASLGVAWSAPLPAPASGQAAADALIARADVAMYESKRAGNGRPVLR